MIKLYYVTRRENWGAQGKEGRKEKQEYIILRKSYTHTHMLKVIYIYMIYMLYIS